MKSLTRIVLPAALLLAACGDDITEQINANVGAVKNTDDLPACTEDIAGQTAYLKETHEFLGCDGSEWQPLSASTVSVGDNVCMSKSLSDDSGFEIFCNGESIGTVKNGAKGEPGAAGKDGADGKDGTNGKDGADGAKGDKGDKGDKGADGTNGTNGTDGTNGTGCEISEATALTATIACGSETFTMDLTGYVEQPAECDATQYEDCTGPMDNVDLSGVSQKGPFVIGADITAYELENGRSLKQTGKTFGGKIERADGTFDIKTVKLKSTFVYLVADGFYRNEVTGENSAATIKLRALTNRQNHANTNINLVTHLEYDRVQRLVTKEDSTVQNAKKAAEKEIFAAFGIDSKDFKGYAEDYNILEEGDGNAALLAISALLQGDRNESELTALLAALSVDLGDNGVWDNQKQRAQIADWAMKKDIEGGLAAIRANIKAWKLRDGEPPAFEGHVRNFWMQELGVDECNKGNAGTLFAVKNANSKFYAAKDSAFAEGDRSLVRLICDASGEDPAWRFATDIEKDTAALPAESGEGAVAKGKIDTGFVYVKEDGDWRRGTELDATLDAACVESNKGLADSLMVKREPVWYICDVGDDASVPFAWREATTAEADTALFGIPGDGDPIVRIGNVNKSHYYVYEGEWRYGTALDLDEDLGPCVADKVNKVLQSSAGSWYKCVNDRNTRVEGVLVPTEWRESTSFERDTVGFGTPSVATAKWNSAGTTVYVYDETAKKWRVGSALDMNAYLGPCTEARTDTIRGTSSTVFYRCAPNYTADANTQPVSWIKLSQAEYDTLGFGYCNRDYMSRVGSEKWFTRDGIQVASGSKESDLIRESQETCSAPVSNSSIEVRYGMKPYASDGFVIQGRDINNYYTYDEFQKEWVPMTRDQFELGLDGCTIARTNYTVAESDEYETYPKGMVRFSENKSQNYLCKDDGGVRKWVPASVARYETYGLACSKEYPRQAYMAYGNSFDWDNYKYVCEADTFRLMTPSEKWAGTVDHYTSSLLYARCAEADEGEVKTLYVAYERYSNFVCKNKLYVWDGKESTVQNNSIHTPMHTTQWGAGAGAYNVWDGGGVVIGPRLWLSANLYADTVGAAGPYILNPEAESLDEIKKIGLYYSHEQAQAACASITYSGDAFRLPTPSDYKALYNQYAEKPSNLFSRDGWEVAGNDYFGLAIYPNGQLDDYGDETYRYKIGYYTDESKDDFVKIGYSYNSTSIIATLRTSEPDSVVLFWPTTWGEKMKFVEQEYAPVRCVLGDIPDPPTSND
ncbi:hypothetical protein [Fibrobacter sp.]